MEWGEPREVGGAVSPAGAAGLSPPADLYASDMATAWHEPSPRSFPCTLPQLLLSGLTYLLADTGLQPGGYVRLAWGPEVAVAEGGQQQRLVLVEVAPELELEKEQEEEKEEVVSQPAQVGPASPAAAATAQAPAAVPLPPAPAYDPLFTDTLRLSMGRRNRLNGRVTLRTFFPEATQAVIAAQGGSETVQLHCRLEGTGGLKRYDVLLSYTSSKSGNNVSGLAARLKLYVHVHLHAVNCHPLMTSWLAVLPCRWC